MAKRSWSLRFIRDAIRNQRLSFPSQVPVLARVHRPDIHWKIVLLYFVRGWPAAAIAPRYGVTRERIIQILRQWSSKARVRGYLGRV